MGGCSSPLRPKRALLICMSRVSAICSAIAPSDRNGKIVYFDEAVKHEEPSSADPRYHGNHHTHNITH